MCGIAGFVQRQRPGDSSESFENRLTLMTDRMAKRGPDGSGHWVSQPASHSGQSWRAALGHRRLSIIDLEGGAQPLGNESGRIQITFNGEIFNFQSLRPELEKKGHQFRTRSDTEVIVHHFEEYGEEGIRDLNGMFAFGIWDQDRCRLVLARDRAGIKPLYYSCLPDGGLAFASEMTALTQHPEVRRKLSMDAVSGYFFSDYFQSPESILEGVFKLDPGCFLVWENGKLSAPQAFWKIQDFLKEHPLPKKRFSVKESSAELQHLLETSVERQLISDVPVGVFLSGGIDSSVIAALARKKAGKGIRTFSIAFEDKDFDESGFARQVAHHIGADHQEELLTEAKLLENLDAALNTLDEPMADPSILPTFLLSRLTARSVKVALGGDAGDELFAGYPTYKADRYARYYKMMPKVFRSHVVEGLVSRLPVKLTYQSFEWKAKRFAMRWDSNQLRRHLRWMSATDIKQLPEIIKQSEAREPWLLRRNSTLSPSRDGLNALLALDFQTYMSGSVLTKVDRASMGNSLEVRPPFLDNEVVDWAFTLPSHLKLRMGTSKFLLKHMAKKLLPHEIVTRRKKGFAIPLGRWLRGPLKPRVEVVLRDSPIWDHPAFLRDGFRSWAHDHMGGKADYSKPLWSLIVLDQWMRRERIDV